MRIGKYYYDLNFVWALTFFLRTRTKHNIIIENTVVTLVIYICVSHLF